MTRLPEQYEVIEELGVGGHAVVLLATDRTTDRQVVIKRMHDHLPKLDPTYEQRFGREAQILETIQHPNIVSVLGHGGDPESGFFLVMEHLPGGTLDQWLRSEPSPTHARVVDIGVQLCGALEHAWDKGVLHRDIKPANILFDSESNPVLCDFGIAKVDESTTLTGTGETLGTPAYMSPEQVQGHEMDFRSDLYSLGLILFEMLEGYLPFRKQDAIATSLARLTEPLPEACAENSAFRIFFQRTLAQNPQERFASFAEASDELARSMIGGVADPTLPLQRQTVSEGSARFEVRLDLPIYSSQRLGSGVHRNIDSLTSMTGDILPGIEDAVRRAAGWEKKWSDPIAVKPSYVTKLQVGIERLIYKQLAILIRVDEDQVLLPRTRFVTYDESGLAIIHLQVDAPLSALELIAYSPDLGREDTESTRAAVVGIRRILDENGGK